MQTNRRRSHAATTAARIVAITTLVSVLGACAAAGALPTADPTSVPTAVPTEMPTATPQVTRPPNNICPTPPPAPSEVENGTVTVVAELGAAACGFDTIAIVAPAGEAFEILFVDNDVTWPHNVNVGSDPELNKTIAEGEYLVAPARAPTKVPALEPGTYYFWCDLHAVTMKGILTVP